jgi:hypothetical protein
MNAAWRTTVAARLLTTWAAAVWAGAAAGQTQLSMTVGQYSHRKGDYELVNTAYNQLPATLISPHIAWARNPAWGEPRVLLVLPTWASRDAVELKQRFPCQVSVVMTRSHLEWAVPKSGEPYGEADAKEPTRIALTLLHRPDKYDAIVIGKVDWSAIPEPVRQLVLDRVATGSGLVYVSPRGLDERLEKLRADNRPKESPSLIAEGVPLAMLPLRNEKRGMGPLEIATAQYGQGRVVFVDYRDHARILEGGNEWRYAVGAETIALTPFVEDDPLFYDYYYSLLGKALLWAARKDPESRIVPKSEAFEIDSGKLPGSLALFAVTVGKQGAACIAHVELRDRDNRVIVVRQVPLPMAAGPSEVALDIPRVKTGLYVADLWLIAGGHVANWASIRISVVGPEYIEAVVPDKACYGRGEAIRGTVRFRASLPAGATVRVELLDPHQRVVSRTELQPTGRSAAFALDARHPLARVFAVVASVVDKDGVRQARTAHVGVPDRSVRDFLSLMWSAAISSRTQRILREQCRRHEVDGYYDGVLFLGEETTRQCAFNLAWSNLVAQPYAQHINVGTHWTVLADYLRNCADPLRARAAAYAPYGTVGYSICEENYIEKTDKQWGRPEALAEYRQWAQARYGSLDKANEVWGSSLAKWEDLGLITLAEAKRRDCFPRWVAQERYRQDFFMRVHEAAAAKVREGDSGARITLDCIEGHDFDWPRAAGFAQGGWANGHLVPFVMYGPDAVYGEGIGWNPGQLDAFRMRFFPWKALLDGGQIIFWWPIGFHQGLGGAAAFTPDASEPLLCFSQMVDEVRRIHHGVGTLLVQSQKAKDPIVMNHSTMSYYASVLNRREITWEDSRKMFRQVLGRIGRTARELTPREMENLRYSDAARVLILPYSQSMTEKEIAAVKRFAEDGGLVVADFAPALFDGDCRPYGKPELVSAGKETTCPRCAGKMRYEEATPTVTRWVACPVCAGTGRILEGREVRYTGSRLEDFFGSLTPMRLTNHGKGKSLYLGKLLGQPGDWEGFANLLEQYAGLKPHFRVLDALGNPRTDVVTAAFVNGSARFVCFLPEQLVAEPPGPETTVQLPERRHIYDVLRQDYLGHTAIIRTGAVPAVPKIFAALPCRLESLSLRVSGTQFAPGAEAKVRATLAPAEIAGAGLCVRFEVLDPAGHPLAHYTRKVVANSGEFELIVPLALNETPGRYTVQAEEIVSGLRAETAYIVAKDALP